jgi:hypothetical protein
VAVPNMKFSIFDSDLSLKIIYLDETIKAVFSLPGKEVGKKTALEKEYILNSLSFNL